MIKNVDIFDVVKKEMNDVNEENFLPKKEDYKNKKKIFLNNVKSLKDSFPRLKKKGNVFSRTMERLSKKFFKNDGCKKHYEETIKNKFMILPASSIILGILSSVIFSSFNPLYDAFKSDHYVETGFFMLSTLFFLGLSILTLSIVTPIFSSKVNYLIKLKDMISEHNSEKEDFIINKSEYLKNKSCIQNLGSDVLNIKDCSLVDKVVSKNVIEFLKKNLARDQKKTLLMFCNDEGNITYREVVKFANYIEKADSFKSKVFMEEKEERYAV